MHTARLMNSLAQGLKRMVTKVRWPCWKLHDDGVAYFKIWNRRSLQRFCGRAQTYWSQSDVFDSLKPCYVMLTFETRIHRLEWLAQVILISVTPMLQILRIGVRCAREAAWKLAKNIVKIKEKHKTAFFSPSENRCLPAPSTRKPEEWEFVVDSGASMHMISKKGLEFCWNGNFDDVEKSDDGYNSQWWSTDAWRGHILCQTIGYILDNESPRKHASSFIAGKTLRWTRKLIRVDQRSKTTSH